MKCHESTGPLDADLESRPRSRMVMFELGGQRSTMCLETAAELFAENPNYFKGLNVIEIGEVDLIINAIERAIYNELGWSHDETEVTLADKVIDLREDVNAHLSA